MKNIIRKKVKQGFLILLLSLTFSCNEEEFLKEKPLDFFSPENSFQTYSNFQSSLTDLYAKVRDIQFGFHNEGTFCHFLGTDIAKDGRGQTTRFGDYDVYMVPTNWVVLFQWENWYKIITNSNTILSRLDESNLAENQKKLVAAEAKFFRAYSYRFLVYLYGGVPLVLDEISSPKTDFTRASKTDVLNQMVVDLTEAAANLPGIDDVVDGKVSNLIAQHYLAETYISLGEYDKAISATSFVIEDPSTYLMTERFGVKANIDPYDPQLKFYKPGDVYRDLFTRGNQNRNTGNTEALWVAQFEVDVPGGGLESSGGKTNQLERWAVPAHWTLTDPDGSQGFISSGQSTYNVGGRGVSFMRNTDFFLYDLWESDWENDIRNAPHNIIRDYVYNNPESAYFDSSAVKYPGPRWLSQEWRWYPFPSKVTTPGDHPDELFSDKDGLWLRSSASSTYRDMYILRLAETYLLRAEAYLRKGELGKAAADINVIRERSNASLIAAGEVDIDYILDERGRELVYEEPRRITLMRLDMLVERVRKYNKLNQDEIKDHHKLWPIPFSEIEANKDVVIEQNPGYN